MTCPICDDDVPVSDTYSLGDGHRFCTSCWREYLSSAFSNGRAVILTPCPAYQCPTLTHSSTFERLCSAAEYERYSAFVLRSYVEDNVSMRWCTSPSCAYAIHAFHRRLQSVVCPAGHAFCFQCQEEAHEPCSCAQLTAWKEKNLLESDNAHWIIANTKRCPQCAVRIEKNQGPPITPPTAHCSSTSSSAPPCETVISVSLLSPPLPVRLQSHHVPRLQIRVRVLLAIPLHSQAAASAMTALAKPTTRSPSSRVLIVCCLVFPVRWCWVCNGSWVDHGNHTGGFYKCNKYDPRAAGKAGKWKVEGPSAAAAAATAEAAAERKESAAPPATTTAAAAGKEKEKSAEALKVEKDAELNRYLFYYQRYHNHAESAKFASQLRRETDKKMALIAAAAHSPHPPSTSSSSPFSPSSSGGEALLIDYAFLQQATDVILRCRHVLKYTYVFAFFLVGPEREQERALFEFLQQQLEKSVEALSELSEQKVDVLAKKETKSTIVNYTRITDKFRENLLTGVRNGLSG